MDATPFRMTPDVIREVVQKHRAGVYILGDVINGEFAIRYVGRSDHCLQTRLLTHGYLYNCQYFIFSYAEDAKSAFELESKWWHDCRNTGHHLLNKIHPDSPSGMMLDCPFCQFTKRMQDLLEWKQVS